ncbi:MAG TPA: DUF2461 domain-containing protein [Myxococcales bacterium]|nr:DUF2461 domain-containing protein [Myxococcales bacterium]
MFQGIGPKAGRLITELAHRQDKAWYAGHKAEIDEIVYAPLRALLEEAKPAIARFYRGEQMNLKVFRIHRDVRFSRDKSPFKDHASGVIMVGRNAEPGTAAGALYLRIGPDEGAAAGMWQMGPEELKRYRAAVLDSRKGAQLEKLLRPLTARGYAIISAAQLARAPKGVDPAHPRAALLRRKGLALDFPPIPRGVRHSRALLGWCVERARDVSPVLRWLLEHTG